MGKRYDDHELIDRLIQGFVSQGAGLRRSGKRRDGAVST